MPETTVRRPYVVLLVLFFEQNSGRPIHRMLQPELHRYCIVDRMTTERGFLGFLKTQEVTQMNITLHIRYVFRIFSEIMVVLG